MAPRTKAQEFELRKKAIKKKPTRAPMPFSVEPIERKLARVIEYRLRQVKAEFKAFLRTRDQEIREAFKAATPAALRKDDTLSEVERLIEQFKIYFSRELSDQDILNIAERSGAEVEDLVSKSVDRQWKRVLGINPLQNNKEALDYIRERMKITASLIKSVPERRIPLMHNYLLDAYQRGLSLGDIEEKIDAEFAGMTTNSERLARTEIGKIYSSTTEFRQKELGVEKFKWVTAGDDRVRESHLEAERNDVGFGPGIYRWDEPPIVDGVEATPGDPINCRCIALPVLD